MILWHKENNIVFIKKCLKHSEIRRIYVEEQFFKYIYDHNTLWDFQITTPSVGIIITDFERSCLIIRLYLSISLHPYDLYVVLFNIYICERI